MSEASEIKFSIFHYLKIFSRLIGSKLYIVFGLSFMASLAEGVGIALFLPLLASMDSGSAGFTDKSGRLTEFVNEIFHFLGLTADTITLLVVITTLFVIKGVFLFGVDAYKAYLNASARQVLRMRIYDAYSRMTYAYYALQQSGHLLAVITGHVGRTVTCALTLTSFGAAVISACVYFISALIISFEFGVSAMMIGLIFLLLFRKLNSYVRFLSRQKAREQSLQSSLLVQSLQAFKYLLSTDQGEILRGPISKSVAKLSRKQKRLGITSAFTKRCREPLAIVSLTLVVVLNLTYFSSSLPEILVSILLFYRCLNTVLSLQGYLQDFQSGVGSVEILTAELNALENNSERTVGIDKKEIEESIRFKSVVWCPSDSERRVLDNISIEIKKNQMTAVVGPSGGGKSSLLDLVAMVRQPTEGIIEIDGIDSLSLEPRIWRRQIGFVSQDAVIFDTTIAQNITMWGDLKSNQDDLMTEIHEAARMAGILDEILDLPEGFSTRVGEKGYFLSGGQRQRLFIARELFRRPKLLILDEATSALDSHAENSLRSSLKKLKGTITILIVAHRLATIKDSDYVYYLDKGTIVEHGTYASLTEDSLSALSSALRAQKV